MNALDRLQAWLRADPENRTVDRMECWTKESIVQLRDFSRMAVNDKFLGTGPDLATAVNGALEKAEKG